MMASTSNTAFKCALCSQVCASKPDLSEHMSLHLGNKKYSCTLCGKKFFNEKSLELHISIHATEIKYEAMSTSSEEQIMLSDHVDNLINENQGNKIPQVKVRVKSFPANTTPVKETHLKNLDSDQMHFQLTDEEFGVIEESEVYTTCGEVLQEKRPVQLKVWSKDQNCKQVSDVNPCKAPYVIRVMDKNQESQRVMESDIFRGNEGHSQLPIRIFVGSNIRLENLEDLHSFSSLTDDFKAEGLSAVNIGHEHGYGYESYEESSYQEESQQNQPLQGIKDLQSLQEVIEEGDLQSLQEELGSEELKSLEETIANEHLQTPRRVIVNSSVKLPEEHKGPFLPQTAVVKEAQTPVADEVEDQTSNVFTCESAQLTQEGITDGNGQSSQCEFEEKILPVQKPQEVDSHTSLKMCPLPLSELHSGEHEEVWEETKKIQSSNSEECVGKQQQLSLGAGTRISSCNKDEDPINVTSNFETENSMVPVLGNEDEGNFRCADELDPVKEKDEAGQPSKVAETWEVERDAYEFKRQVMQSSKRPHRCQVCGLGFRFAFYLKAHQSVHWSGNRKLLCDICGKGFKTMDSYEKHQKIHEAPKTFQYPGCMKELGSEDQLKRHVVLHKQMKQYECQICHEKFTTNRLLRSHSKCHTINKCYICDKIFRESSKLKRHLTTHLNKKLYDCTSCGRTLYCHPTDFERHKMMHQNLVTCPDCFRDFPFENFQRHMKTCSGKICEYDTYKESHNKKSGDSRRDFLIETEDENKVRSRVAEVLIDDLLHDMSKEDMQGNPFLCDAEDWLETTSEGMTKEKLKDSIADCTTKGDVLRELSIYFENDIIKDAISDCLLRERVAVQQLSCNLAASEKLITFQAVGRKRKRRINLA
ncbi:uncharacterized protein LOC135226526 [Macrobrachium nipponense]|uniref:uncharacterized protein LOC135226526 n=1 Tax=Macrobrachium nipponense TaxID=159736 RepID=UPI0030C7DB4E